MECLLRGNQDRGGREPVGVCQSSARTGIFRHWKRTLVTEMAARIIRIVALCLAWMCASVSPLAGEAEDEASKIFSLAYGLYTRGPAFYGQAVIQFREFLRRYPGDERCDLATMFLGDCLREQEKYTEALQLFLDHQKFKNSLNRDKVDLRTGQVYFSLGKYPDAIRCLSKVYGKKVEENLADSAAFWLGWAYLKNNQPKDAIPVLTKLADKARSPLAPSANFQLAYAHLAMEELDKAIERFQKTTQAMPERKAESLFRMAEAHVKLKKYREAYSAYKELVEKHPESPFRGRSAFGAVWSLYTAKDYENAIVVHGLCQKVIPQESRAEATYILGNCYYEVNKLAEALDAYRRVVKEFPTSPFAARSDYKACWCLFLQNKFDELVTAGREFIKKNASFGEIGNVHFLVGESLYEKNRSQEALTEYLTVVERFPKCPFREKASFKLGLCYLKTVQTEKARKTFREFATAYPNSELAAKALARSAECGLALAGAKEAKPEFVQLQYEELARDYRTLAEKYPNDPLAGEALYQLGVTCARLNKNSEMAAAFEKLVKSYPKNENCAEAYYWLGSENEKEGKDDVAANYFEQSISLKPKGRFAGQAKYRLAEIYYKKEEHEKAASLITQMLKENLQSEIPVKTHLWAGDFFLEKEKYDQAIEVYDLFLKKFGTTPSPQLEGARYGLGYCYFKQEKWQKAIDSFAKAIDMKGEWVSLSRLYSGIAHLKLGQTSTAEKLLREVVKSGVLELEAKATYWLGNMHFELAKGMKTNREKAERYKLARAEYVKVVILYTNSEHRPESMYRVAECLEQEGLAKDANKQLQELIKEYPNDEFEKKAREKLGETPAGAGGK